MKNTHLPLESATSFSKLLYDYLHKNTELSGFYSEFPDLEGFKNKIENRKGFKNRAVLVNSLKQQYNNVEHELNLDILLDENTFTVCTGHQLNIFSGPLYVIFKIVSTINLAKKLKENFPDKNFVPIYWMASEDHDFEEISYFNLFGKKLQWQTTQTGAVGRFKPQEIKELVADFNENFEPFLKSYAESKTLADAVRLYFHKLFGDKGLVTLDADRPELKALFKEVMKADILHNNTENEVKNSTEALENLNYKTQISARTVNFFYLEENSRFRLDWEGEKLVGTGSNISLSKDQISDLIESKPEVFSPNVVLRPVYQETILPNLAYLGGPSEVCYWLQLKSMFDKYETSFPVVMPRNMALVINGSLNKKLEKLNLKLEDIFKDRNTLKKEYVASISENELSFDQEKTKISSILAEINSKAQLVDPTLGPSVEAEKSKILGILEGLEKKIKKQEERKFEVILGQIDNTLEKLFPGGGLQERHDNILSFMINEPNIIEYLCEAFDPLNFNFNVITLN